MQAEEALSYLKERKEFWAAQQPEQHEFPVEMNQARPKSSWHTMIKKADNG